MNVIPRHFRKYHAVVLLITWHSKQPHSQLRLISIILTYYRLAHESPRTLQINSCLIREVWYGFVLHRRL